MQRFPKSGVNAGEVREDCPRASTNENFCVNARSSTSSAAVRVCKQRRVAGRADKPGVAFLWILSLAKQRKQAAAGLPPAVVGKQSLSETFCESHWFPACAETTVNVGVKSPALARLPGRKCLKKRSRSRSAYSHSATAAITSRPNAYALQSTSVCRTPPASSELPSRHN